MSKERLKRIQLFEFEDFPWFPRMLRECMTLYIRSFHRLIGTSELLAPLIARALELSSTDKVVDLCTGSGGPMIEVARRLAEQGTAVNLTLTDLYPNRVAMNEINQAGNPALRYLECPIHAGDVPDVLPGLRTLVASFHHIPPPLAKRILRDALEKKQPICIFEISDNELPRGTWWLTLPIAVMVVLLGTPFVRPLTWKQLFFTYVIPILPFVIAWDGTASNARTYGTSDLRVLTQELSAPGYRWEIGTLHKRGFPSGFPYLLGLPGMEKKV